MKNILIWALIGVTFILLLAPYLPANSSVSFGAVVATACAGGVYITGEWRR